ncbi:MAG: ABC transporter substrate-binding protein [Acidimicrobiaceae bacterium]|nr:ABC transporter substrate-binding protein [Acidimicrobiaceae bacterium]
MKEKMKRISRSKIVHTASASSGVLALALITSACGSSGSSSATTTAAKAGATTTTAASAPISITIGDTAIGAGYADIYVGILDGIFAKNGLNVKLVKLNTSSQLVPALVGGSVQIGVGVADDTAAAILKGIPLQFIGLSEGTYNLEMWGDASIKSVQGIVGKKVALSAPDSESDFGLTALLAKNNIPETSVKRVYTGSIPGMVSALESGSANALLTQPPQGTSTGAKGFVKIADLSNLPFAVGSYTVTAAYAKANPTVLQRWANAEAQNLAFIHDHPNKTIAAIEADSGVTDPALAKYAYNFFLNVWTKTPVVKTSLIQDAFTRAAAKAKKTAPADVTQYIDNTFAQNATNSAG